MHLSIHKGIALAVLPALVALGGCGAGDEKPGATQVAARVNQQELSIHQINAVLARSSNLAAEQAQQASTQILERLIDQELLIQQARERKLDREPRVLQAMEAARREILARAYVEQLTAAAAKPGAGEIAEFYDKHPELFSERRIYSLRELAIGAKPEMLPELQEQMSRARSFAELAQWLKSRGIPFSANVSTKPAEQIPLELLGRFHQLKDGQSAVVPTANALLIVQLAASQTLPLDERQATPFIEQYLLNQRKATLAEQEVKALRAKARIEYVGEFARKSEDGQAAAQAAAAGGRSPAEVAGQPHMDKGVAGLK